MTPASFKKIIAKLINRQFKRSELAKPFLKKKKKRKSFPCITISRETGSGGRLIATLTAKKLKMKFYNKEFVDLIAQSAKKTKEVVEVLDERSRNMVEGVVASLQSPDNKFSNFKSF